MSAAAKLLAPLLAVGLAACGSEQQSAEQNQAANAAATDVEVLPADESVATTSGELANGVNEPDVTNLGNQH